MAPGRAAAADQRAADEFRLEGRRCPGAVIALLVGRRSLPAVHARPRRAACRIPERHRAAVHAAAAPEPLDVVLLSNDAGAVSGLPQPEEEALP